MLIMGIMLTTNIYADYSSQRPNRRARARKQYTSPEIIKAEQDSLMHDSVYVATHPIDIKEEKPRTNTLQQIDSVIAMKYDLKVSSTIEAAATLEKKYIYNAAMMDPLTGTELNIKDIYAMVDEMLEAHKDWLPEYH